MLSKLEVEGRVFRPGDRLEAVDISGEIHMCSPGMVVEILCIKNEPDSSIYIGVTSKTGQLDWHDLNGRCEAGHGLWLTPNTLLHCFRKLPNVFEVKGSFSFRRQNLKGMRFRLLSRAEDNMLLAEMEENVGGGGGDGMGKAGHCVLLPAGLAKEVKVKKK